MRSTQFLVLFLVFIKPGGSVTIHDIRQMISVLCPGSDACQDGAQNRTFIEDSCCTDCSCEPSCKYLGNCCFPEGQFDAGTDDNAAPVTTNIGSYQKVKNDSMFTCVYPLSIQDPPFSLLNFQSFWMIRGMEMKNRSLNITHTCDQENVAPWGNMWPITSRSTGKIYFNRVCAAEHKVKDGVVWTVALACKDRVDNFEIDGTELMFGLEGGHFPDYCHMVFTPPKAYPPTRYMMCFKDLIRTCRLSEFKIPDSLLASKEDIIEACESGLESPYRNFDMFANVFCHICGTPYFEKSATCTPYLSEKRTSGTNGYLTALLGMDYMKTILTDRWKTNPVLEKACYNNGSKTDGRLCRSILCPSGQVPNSEGVCFYPTASLGRSLIFLYIKLTSDRVISIPDFFEKQSISNMKSPWNKAWHVLFCYYKVLNESLETDELLVALQSTPKSLDTAKIMETVRKRMATSWKLISRNTTVLLQPSFWEFKEMMPSYLAYTTIRTEKAKVYKMLDYNTPLGLFKPPTFISKMYFCPQIQLAPSEFEFHWEKQFIYNRLTQRYLGNAEFTRIYDQNDLAVRVCLEQSGFQKQQSHGSSLRIFIPGFIINVMLVVFYSE